MEKKSHEKTVMEETQCLIVLLTSATSSWAKDHMSDGHSEAIIGDSVINAHFGLGVQTYVKALQHMGKTWPEIMDILSQHLLKTLECMRMGTAKSMDAKEFFGEEEAN